MEDAASLDGGLMDSGDVPSRGGRVLGVREYMLRRWERRCPCEAGQEGHSRERDVHVNGCRPRPDQSVDEQRRMYQLLEIKSIAEKK